MIKTLKLQLLSALFLGTLTLAGCKDECKDVTCVQGACVDGNCVCDAGYLGSDCSVAANLKYDGTYTLSETCSISGTWSYTITVAPKAANALQATFLGFYQEDNDMVTATIGADGTTFTIPKQNLGTSGYQLEGTAGTISADGKTITLNYAISSTSGIPVETCSAVLTR